MAKHKTFGWSRISLAVAATAVSSAGFLAGCEKGGVGDPCLPEDEYQGAFGGYSEKEVNVESRSFQCETRVCLVNKFKGRVSCKYGTANGQKCEAPDKAGDVTVPVAAQLHGRPPSDSVYCSCRCAGAQKEAPYCDCPSGFDCKKLIDDIGLGNSQLAGSYCVRSSTEREVEAVNPCVNDKSSRFYCGEAEDFYR